jgi:hypothetical protein
MEGGEGSPSQGGKPEKEEEKYLPRRGDFVELKTDGNPGIVAGYVDRCLICVVEFTNDGRENIVIDVGDVALLAKAEEIESILPKQLDIKPTNPS